MNMDRFFAAIFGMEDAGLTNFKVFAARAKGMISWSVAKAAVCTGDGRMMNLEFVVISKASISNGLDF